MDSSQEKDAHPVSLKATSPEDDQFLLEPVLTLPPSFGQVYVGQPFTCILSANNELLPNSPQQVSNLKLAAEMQTPSGTLSLDLEEPQDAPSLDTSAQQRPEQQQQPSTGGDKNNAEDKNSTKRTDSGLLQPDHPIQRTLRFDLREEGSHTLAVSLSYYSSTITPSPSPASPAASAASSGRVRTFRKLYQFTARPCLNVRTKVSLPKAGPGIGGGGGGTGKSGDAASGAAAALPILALEAQIDNLADGPIVLRNVTFAAKAAFKATGLNWDVFPLDREEDIRKEGLYSRCPILAPREVYQVAFLIEEVGGAPAPKKESLRDGRVMLGQLGLRWASEMGEEGFLTTGMLTKRR